MSLQIYHEWPGITTTGGRKTTYAACDTTPLYVVAMHKLDQLSKDDMTEEGSARAGGCAGIRCTCDRVVFGVDSCDEMMYVLDRLPAYSITVCLIIVMMCQAQVVDDRFKITACVLPYCCHHALICRLRVSKFDQRQARGWLHPVPHQRTESVLRGPCASQRHGVCAEGHVLEGLGAVTAAVSQRQGRH